MTASVSVNVNLESYLDRLMQFYTSGAYLSEVQSAKEEFFEKAGTFDETSSDFELKMAQFSDWYLFIRRMTQSGRAAIEMALDEAHFAQSSDDRGIFLNLRNSRHSLFEFLKVKGDDVYIKDLFTGFKYVLQNSKVNLGFNRDEYFEARLVPMAGGFVFSSAFCFHPAVVCSFVLSEIKRILALPEEQQADAREELIGRLFKMKHKYEQYRHLDIHQIYSNESKLRF